VEVLNANSLQSKYQTQVSSKVAVCQLIQIMLQHSKIIISFGVKYTCNVSFDTAENQSPNYFPPV